MAGNLCISVKTDESQALLQQLYKQDSKSQRWREACNDLAGYFKDLAGGRRRGVVNVQTGAAAPVRASGTFTFVSVNATDAFTIGGVTFTYTSTPTLETDIEVDGATDALDTQAAVDAVNAHSTLSKIVVATRSTNVMTITCRVPGVIGNFIATSDADTTITTSAAYLSGGTGGATDTQAVFNCRLS